MNNQPLHIAPGAIVGIQGTDRRCVVTQLLPGGLVGVRDYGSRQPPEKVSVGLLIHPPLSKQEGTGAIESTDLIAPFDRDLSTISPADWELAKRRREIILPLLAVHRPPTSLVKQVALDAHIHWTRIYAYMRAFRNSGKMLTSLLNGAPSVPKGTERLHPVIEKVLRRVILKHYLTKQRLRVSKVNEAMTLAFAEDEDISRLKANGEKLDKPHLNTIRARINAGSPRKRAEARDGADKATKYTAQGSGFVASYPLEYVQIDHTRINVILRDDKTGYILGRPWITIAIDIFSRMIVGYYISFETPGAIGTGLCVSHLILPKDDWLREYASAFVTVPEWPCYGRPVNIHADNAKEFRGDMLARACAQYNIDLIFRPLKTPQYGAHIESLMDKLSEEFRTLPGATFSNPQERGKNYDSEEESALSLAEFCAWFANHICVVYHYRPHSGLGKSPLERWEEGFFKGTELAPPLGNLPDRYIGEAAEQLRLDFIPFEERVISEEGVRIDKIHYMDDVLCRWINAKDPEEPKKSRYFTFRRDPRDISIIYFWNPELNKYEPIPYRNAALTAITLWELRAARKHLSDMRRLPNHLHSEAMIFEAVRKKRDLVEIAKARKGKFKAAGQHRPGVHKGRPQPGTPDKPESPGSDTPKPKSNRDAIGSFDDVDFD